MTALSYVVKEAAPQPAANWRCECCTAWSRPSGSTDGSPNREGNLKFTLQLVETDDIVITVLSLWLLLVSELALIGITIACKQVYYL